MRLTIHRRLVSKPCSLALKCCHDYVLLTGARRQPPRARHRMSPMHIAIAQKDPTSSAIDTISFTLHGNRTYHRGTEHRVARRSGRKLWH